MRIWDVDPKILCRKHLLGEHVECHMFAGTIQKSKSIRGYISKGLVNPRRLKKRHDELAQELARRGYNHQSEFPTTLDVQNLPFSSINWVGNIEELKRRCPECKKRMKEAHHEMPTMQRTKRHNHHPVPKQRV